ncbi:MAG: metal-sulfur cluster assembly factor [Gammaproteobacteria bacterium]
MSAAVLSLARGHRRGISLSAPMVILSAVKDRAFADVMPMINAEDVEEVLRECFDPEIPVNVLDLGLIYDVAVEGNAVNIKMTLTAPGCSMGAMIATEIEDKLLGLPDCERAIVEIVWEPPWTPHRMSEAARKQLGLDD